MELVILNFEAVLGESVEVGDGLVHGELGGRKTFPLQHGLHGGDVAVIDVAVGDHVDELAHLQAGDLGHHVGQHRVLHHVPVVGRQHILGALVQNGVEGVAGDVEGHGVSAGIQVHLMQILEIVDIG